MPRLPSHAWVREPAALEDLRAAMGEAPWIALDSESNSMFAYHERVCLLQLNVGGELWLVDPLALAPDPDAAEARAEALAPLGDPLADPKLRVWVHGGEYDVACLKRDFGLELAGLFDTQQAASFLGWQRTGYAAVVEEICGVTLAKGHAQYDWGRRPIDESALRYALDDVVHLPEVGAEMRSLIAAADLEEELELANQGVAGAAAHGGAGETYDPGRMWKLKGVAEVPRERLPVLAALHAWRDQLGRELDMPPGRLIANAPLVALARRAPRTREQLRRVRLRRSLVREHGGALLEEIAGALADPPKLPPRPRRKRPPAGEARRARALKSWRREEAERRELPLHVVLPPRALEWIVEHGAEALERCPELGEKRIDRYGEVLARLCEDEAT